MVIGALTRIPRWDMGVAPKGRGKAVSLKDGLQPPGIGGRLPPRTGSGRGSPKGGVGRQRALPVRRKGNGPPRSRDHAFPASTRDPAESTRISIAEGGLEGHDSFLRGRGQRLSRRTPAPGGTGTAAAACLGPPRGVRRLACWGRSPPAGRLNRPPGRPRCGSPPRGQRGRRAARRRARGPRCPRRRTRRWRPRCPEGCP